MQFSGKDKGGPSKGGFLNNLRNVPEQYIVYVQIPLITLHKFRSVYENNRLFRKPPLLGPLLSCANTPIYIYIYILYYTILYYTVLCRATLYKAITITITITITIPCI